MMIVMGLLFPFAMCIIAACLLAGVFIVLGGNPGE
jgi:hypothetical protein